MLTDLTHRSQAGRQAATIRILAEYPPKTVNIEPVVGVRGSKTARILEAGSMIRKAKSEQGSDRVR